VPLLQIEVKQRHFVRNEAGLLEAAGLPEAAAGPRGGAAGRLGGGASGTA
jgi:hypothetical protein